jgi:hypothetical protein
MIRDSLLIFDTAANLALVVGTYNSSNIIDLGELSGIPTSASGGGARDLGIGDDPAMKLFSVVTTTFTSGGAGTLAINLQGAPDSGAGAPGTWSTFWTSPTYALATLAAGAELANIDMPKTPAGVAVPRFLRMTYVIGGATMTAGVIDAEIVLDRFDQPKGTTGALSGYAPGITIAN